MKKDPETLKEQIDKLEVMSKSFSDAHDSKLLQERDNYLFFITCQFSLVIFVQLVMSSV